MEAVTFDVLGEPKAQPRAKAARRGSFVHIYTPATAKKWKALVASAAKPFLKDGPRTDALCVNLDFRFARPKSHLTSKGALTKSARRHHTTKPDTDNLAKAVFDALTDAGFWHDDSQVVTSLTTKRYAEPEGVTVIVTPAPSSE